MSDQPDTQPGFWRIDYGIHRRTLTSRDSGVVEYLPGSGGTKRMTSMADCRYGIRAIEADLFEGYVIWYADAIAPDGTRTRIHEGNSYQ